MRITLRAAILLIWGATMVALYQRTNPAFAPIATPVDPLPRKGSEAWQGVYASGKKIGYAVRRRLVTTDGFTLENQAVVRLEMMGTKQVVRTRVTADTDDRMQLRSFRFHLRSEAVEFSADGAVRDGRLVVNVAGGRPIEVPLSGPVVLPQMLHDFLGREKLETGKTFRYALFDPVTAEPTTVELRVGPLVLVDLPEGRRTAFEVTEEFRGAQFRLWISADGEVYREEGPLGLTLVRETEAVATSRGFDDGESLDIVSAAAIPAGREIPEPREVKRLSLRLSGFPKGRPLAFPPRQTADGEILRIETEAEALVASFALPQREPRFAADLAATVFLQSDHEKVRALAREILGDEGDARTAARKLLDWVFQNLEKVPTVSVPNALGVLETRAGDCNEHSVLYAALARAAGLPARVVAGTVYMPGAEGVPGAFFYHAWVEAWLGEWIALDPTFGQFPADATHVKFLDGGPEKHSELLGLIGRVRIDVEDFS